MLYFMALECHEELCVIHVYTHVNMVIGCPGVVCCKSTKNSRGNWNFLLWWYVATAQFEVSENGGGVVGLRFTSPKWQLFSLLFTQYKKQKLCYLQFILQELKKHNPCETNPIKWQIMEDFLLLWRPKKSRKLSVIKQLLVPCFGKKQMRRHA